MAEGTSVALVIFCACSSEIPNTLGRSQLLGAVISMIRLWRGDLKSFRLLIWTHGAQSAAVRATDEFEHDRQSAALVAICCLQLYLRAWVFGLKLGMGYVVRSVSVSVFLHSFFSAALLIYFDQNC